MPERNSHCSYCGAAFDTTQPWPRTCANCGRKTYLNPTPVAVTLIPVDDGLVVIRRKIEPRRGQLALPGGFIVLGESWQEAGAREVMEETGIEIDPASIEEFMVRSAPDSTLLVFGLAPAMRAADLPPLIPNDEVSELQILTAPAELAFSLHTEAVARFFAHQTAIK